MLFDIYAYISSTRIHKWPSTRGWYSKLTAPWSTRIFSYGNQFRTLALYFTKTAWSEESLTPKYGALWIRILKTYNSIVSGAKFPTMETNTLSDDQNFNFDRNVVARSKVDQERYLGYKISRPEYQTFSHSYHTFGNPRVVTSPQPIGTHLQEMLRFPSAPDLMVGSHWRTCIFKHTCKLCRTGGSPCRGDMQKHQYYSNRQARINSRPFWFKMHIGAASPTIKC